MNEEPQRCDWCHEYATHITHHQRANTGTLVAYWCEAHYEQHQRQSLFQEGAKSAWYQQWKT
jgi:hypothetical protein